MWVGKSEGEGMAEEQLSGSNSIKLYINKSGNVSENPDSKYLYQYKFMSLFFLVTF